MFKWLRQLASRKPTRGTVAPRFARRVGRARYDAAATTEENRRHWANADGLSPDGAANPEVRRILRNRARYEVANNSYAKGIVLTLANDTIGTGPRLQLLTKRPAVNQFVEREFAAWCKAIRLAEKLRTLRMARATDGEGFGLLTTNRRLPTKVQLDLRLIEAEQVTTPTFWLGNPSAVDGIVYDAFGNPTAYQVLRHHPGDPRFFTGSPADYSQIRADLVVHYYRPDRAGQSRGVPEITPALPLFAQLRRYTLAVIGAAETAADFAAVLYTDTPPEPDPRGDLPPGPQMMDTVELEPRMATVLPDAWKLDQIEAQQPATTYGDFVERILNEIARCLNMPFNVAAANSAKYNYASGRLDHQTYFKSIRVDRDQLEDVVLDHLFRAWFGEAVLIEGYLPELIRKQRDQVPAHEWMWDGFEHVDPVKEATAQATRLASFTTTLADECARQGKDWEAQLRQRAREIALQKELGLSVAVEPAPAGSEVQDEATQDKQDRD